MPLSTAQLLRRAAHAGIQTGKFCQLLYDRQGETSIRRILGVLSRRSNDLVLFFSWRIKRKLFCPCIASLSLAETGWLTAREKPISLGQQTAPNGQSSQSGSLELLC
jgi:hypothetical protein